MSETKETNTALKPKKETPILQLNRLNYVKINSKVLDTTGAKLDKYISYAAKGMNTEISSGDVIEHALKLLFDRDSGFKEWLKRN